MKRNVFLLGIMFLLVLANSTFADGDVFSDISGTKYEQAIITLSDIGIINGYEDGTFKPENNVTRAQFTKMLVKALNIDENASTDFQLSIQDIGPEHWAYLYVKAGIENNLIKGYGDNTFKPDKNVSYAECMAMILRALNLEDSMEDKSWPNGYMIEAQNRGLLENIDVQFESEYTDDSIDRSK